MAEFGIGTNDKAILTGVILEDEKVMGTIHIAFGDNKSMGGTRARREPPRRPGQAADGLVRRPDGDGGRPAADVRWTPPVGPRAQQVANPRGDRPVRTRSCEPRHRVLTRGRQPNFAALVEPLPGGRCPGLGGFVRRFQGRMFALAYSYAGDREEARDLAQEIFVRLYETRDQWLSGDEFLPWLFRVARNRSIDYLRRRKVRTPARTVPEDALADAAGSRADGRGAGRGVRPPFAAPRGAARAVGHQPRNRRLAGRARAAGAARGVHPRHPGRHGEVARQPRAGRTGREGARALARPG